MDTIELFDTVLNSASDMIESIGDDEWENDTPCDQWSVRELVHHMVYEVSWVPDLLAGNTVKVVGDKYEGDLLAGNPFRAWLEACQKARASVRQPNIMRHQTHLSYGDRLARDYVQELACDVFIHSWDLAKGIGGDDHLNDVLVKIFYKQIKPQADVMRSSDLFGESLKVPLDSSVQTKFLAFVGRKS